jgi:Mrp family chromosome partitioning ATPase
MTLIPEQYQELDLILNEMAATNAHCATFISLEGAEGSSSACASVAKKLMRQNKTVLVIDLNPLSPFYVEKAVNEEAKKWCFDDISCQLSVIEHQEVNLLTIQNLTKIDSAKNKEVMKNAILRLRQEFEYVLLDMSPILKVNRNNIPLHALSECSDIVFLTVALGENGEEALCNGIKDLRHSGHENIKVLVSQHCFKPLGMRIVNFLERKVPKWPRTCRFLKNKISKQTWLFKHH